MLLFYVLVQWLLVLKSTQVSSETMAAAVPDLTTAAGRAEAIAALDPDFQGLLDGETAADIRTFAVDHLALDRNRDVVQVASIVDLRQACKTRMQTRHQAEADAAASAMPPPINKTEAQDLKMRFEQMHYKMEDRVAPSTGTLEELFEQVEAGEWKTMALIQFMSREDQEVEPLAATIDRSGTVKIKKGYGESQPPKNGEELRQKIKLLGHAYMMTQLKYPNRQVLRGITPNLFVKYSDFLLGEHVAGLKAKNAKGE